MSQIWKTIPLLTSSTFRDMMGEQDKRKYYMLKNEG